jgi:putative ABC transport system permease protein
MLKNYIKIAWRNLLKNKGYSLINIGGLAVGMASAMLILLWVQNQMSVDLFHHKKDRLYKAMNRAPFDGELHTWDRTPKPLGPALKTEFPEIANTSRFTDNGNFLFTVGDKKITCAGAFVDSVFLNMFDFPLIAGNQNHILDQPNAIVITETMAKKLFDEGDALGKVIKIDSTDYATVTGVLKDLPNNTCFKFDYLLPWAYMKKIGWTDDYWGNNSIQTYVELTPNSSQRVVESKIKDITIRHHPGNEDTEVFLHALPNWWLYSKFKNGKIAGGRIEMVRLFTVIASFILLIACINFMNLSTARSEKRAKEVGVRKVAGAQKQSLIIQFLSESVIIAGIAGMVALGIVMLAVPSFSELVNQRLSVNYGSLNFWLSALAFVLFTGIMAGSYPALFLSSFVPVKVLKGTFKKAQAAISPRKILVIIQFSIAIILIISTLIINRQIQYGKDRESGYNKNNLIYIFGIGDIEKNYKLIKQELLNNGIASSVTKTSAPITEGWSNSWGFQWQGRAPDDKTVFDRFCVDDGFVKTAGLTLVAGRDMDLSTYPTDSTAVLLNESAVKAMGFANPIGQTVKDNGIEWHVVGVFKDFILQSPYSPVVPMVVEGAKGWFNAIHIKFNTSLETAAALGKTEEIFKRYNPAYPFEYNFVDEAYAKKFEESQRMGNLATLFAFLTIFISCLGLFGLAAYMAETRTKEIGVRKVLGASVFSITKLLSKEFVLLVLISCFVAFPIAYWAMNHFLESFDYRISIGWGTFILAGIGSLLIALLTVSSQAIKAAVINPVKSLRSE